MANRVPDKDKVCELVREATNLNISLWNGEEPKTGHSATYPMRFRMRTKIHYLLAACYHYSYGNIETAHDFEKQANEIKVRDFKDLEGKG